MYFCYKYFIISLFISLLKVFLYLDENINIKESLVFSYQKMILWMLSITGFTWFYDFMINK